MEEHDSPRLVETGWLADHLGDPQVCVAEVDWDPRDGYDQGHIPGALCWRWKEDLWHPSNRDFIEGEAFRDFMGRSGVGPDTTVILYADSTRFATYALFALQLRGHPDARILHGGRTRWIAEGRPLTNEVPTPRRREYRAGPPDPGIRASRDDILAGLGDRERLLLDVRSVEEYRGERVAPPGMATTRRRPAPAR
ncbi:MAG: sulfurtransferase, partial [Nitrospinota bacterium]